MIRRSGLVLGLLSFSLAFGGCKKDPATDTGAEATGPIKIGEFASLTGTTATFGQSSHNGTQMGIEEVNASGGVLGRQLELMTEDDQSKPEEAATAVQKLISRNSVVALLGEVSSGRTLAAAPIAQSRQIPLLSPASTNEAVTQKGDYIFRICFIDPFQGKVLARFALNTLKVKRVAILKDAKNDYSVGLAKAFTDAFTAEGGQIVAEQAYSEGDADFKAQLTSIKATNPEALLVPGYYTEVGNIALQARELGMKMPMFGGDGWDSPQLTKIGGAAIEGAYFSNHFAIDDTTAQVRNFVAAYRKKFNADPDAMAALGYDSARILADAIRRAGKTDGAAIRDALAATKDFQGVTGSITIDPQRNAEKSAVIVQIRNGRPSYSTTIRPGNSPAVTTAAPVDTARGR